MEISLEQLHSFVTVFSRGKMRTTHWCTIGSASVDGADTCIGGLVLTSFGQMQFSPSPCHSRMEGYPDSVTMFILLNMKQCMQDGTEGVQHVAYLQKKPCTMAKNCLQC